MRVLFAAAVAALPFCLPSFSLGQTNPITTGTISLRLDVVATLDTAVTGAPNWGANVGDSRLFVAGQRGQIKILNGGNLLPTPFLDLPTALGGQLVGGTDERGLLGLTFHPEFNEPTSQGFHKVYTYTSENPGASAANAPHFSHPELGSGNGSHQSVVREWTVSSTNPNVVDTSLGSRVLMRIRQPQSNHNGGALVFDNDGYLHIALGDGGGGFDATSGSNLNSTTDGHTNSPGPGLPHGNAQDLSNVFGKILRIKATTEADANTTPSANGQYRIPTSNAFAGATPGLDEIYAYGLRNPFRISVDSATGNIYAADVGQGQREEIDLVVNGGNYGWVLKEGSIDTPFPNPAPDYDDPGNLIAPIAEYTHSDGVAVIGGFVYRGVKIPELQGKYVFGELDGPSPKVGRLFYMDTNSPGPNTIFEFPIDSLGDALPASQLHGFGEGTNGEIYALFRNGQIVELTSSFIPGDFDVDGDVDADDFMTWDDHFPTSSGATRNIGDADGDGDVDGADFVAWQTHFRQAPPAPAAPVPEPATITLALFAIGMIGRLRKRRRRGRG